MKIKKIFKIIFGIIIFFTLPSLLFFGFLYFKYNEDLPTGIEGEQADALAYKMLNSLDYEAFKNTKNIEWTFKKRHHFIWNKDKNTCVVKWKNHIVELDLNNTANSKVLETNSIIENEDKQELINTALGYFNNDSFWIAAPYKVFDTGVERKLVTLENKEKALLVTYTSGGSTPGDSYLWLLKTDGKPYAFKMWTSILPIKGIEASWDDWMTTKSGAQLPDFHKIMVLGLELDNIKAK